MQGDLRGAGPFGALWTRAQLFIRKGAHPSISNADLCGSLGKQTLSNFVVTLWLDPNAESTRTLSAREMEAKCLEHLRVEANGVAVRTTVICPASETVVTLPGAESVVMGEGNPGATMFFGGDLVEHLNGLVRDESGAWAPGDPNMTRIIKLSCDVGTSESASVLHAAMAEEAQETAEWIANELALLHEVIRRGCTDLRRARQTAMEAFSLTAAAIGRTAAVHCFSNHEVVMKELFGQCTRGYRYETHGMAEAWPKATGSDVAAGIHEATISDARYDAASRIVTVCFDVIGGGAVLQQYCLGRIAAGEVPDREKGHYMACFAVSHMFEIAEHPDHDGGIFFEDRPAPKMSKLVGKRVLVCVEQPAWLATGVAVTGVAAAAGRVVQLAPGTYNVTMPLRVPPGVCVRAPADVRIEKTR